MALLTVFFTPRAAHREYHIDADHPPAPARFKVTAYSGSFTKSPIPITKSGTVAHSTRTIAVDPRVIPLGSVVWIEGIGRRIAEDTGGAIKGNILDLYMPTVWHAKQFGVQRRNVWVIRKGY